MTECEAWRFAALVLAALTGVGGVAIWVMAREYGKLVDKYTARIFRDMGAAK